MIRHEAQRRAFQAVEETCPTVDDAADDVQTTIERMVQKAAESTTEALERMVRTIKSECTERLREALIEAYNEVVQLEEERDHLVAQVEALEGRLERESA